MSGEMLAGSQKFGIHPEVIQRFAREVKEIRDMAIEIAIVIGGGNIFRGLAGASRGMDRAHADYMGMLATVMNSLAIQSMLEDMDVPTRVQTAIEMKNVAEPFIRRKATRHLELGRVVIFGAGTGNPFFSTDTTAALRASEIGADAILKATKVDGVYDSDPNENPDAKRYENVTFQECLEKRLKILDSTAFSLCMDNSKPIIVFDINGPDNIHKALIGDPIGTLVHSEENN